MNQPLLSAVEEEETEIESKRLCTTASVRQQSEEIKKALSKTDNVLFSCEMPNIEHGKRNWKIPTTVKFNISLKDFHETCDHLFQKSLVPVNRLLQELDMTPDDIDEVVLVGGTTRIPKIKQQLR